MKKSVSITKISIKNAFGLEDVEIAPGSVTLISGRNGKGKSSVLNAIQSALNGGNNPALLHKGKKNGEIVLALSDDVVIKRRFSEKSNTLTVLKDGKQVKRPQAFINDEYLSSIGCNPLKLLTVNKSERTTLFLDSLPVNIDLNVLDNIYGQPVSQSPGEHGIIVVDRVRKSLYDDRRHIGRLVRSTQNTIDNLSSKIEDNVEEQHERIQTQISEIETQQKQLMGEEASAKSEATSEYEKKKLMLENQLSNLKGELIRINTSISEKTNSTTEDFQRQVDEVIKVNESDLTSIDLEYQRKLDLLKQEHKDKVANLELLKDEKLRGLNDAKELELKSITDGFNERTSRANEKVSEIKSNLAIMDANHVSEKSALSSKYTQKKSDLSITLMEKKSKLKLLNERMVTSQLVNQNKNDLLEIKEQYEKIDTAIHKLDQYKKGLLENFKLEGFDYQDGQVLIDGIPFESVNTARLIDVAVSLARLQSPTLKLMCIDGIEALDEENFNNFVDKAEEYGMNMIVTKVSDSKELMIEAA